MSSVYSHFLLLLLLGQSSAQQADYAQYVNPLIGGSGPFEGLACKSLRILPYPLEDLADSTH